MGPHGLTLHRCDHRDVDLPRDVGGRRPEGLGVDVGSVLVETLTGLGRPLYELTDGVAVDRRLVDVLDTGFPPGGEAHAVHAEVVGVAVPSMVVVDGQHIGVDLAKD